jgi:hypothetical protein
MSVGKKLRFEVFKRDKFTCQYCGKSAPDVTLHCDHIQPISKGGIDNILNLITSCQDCNLGKADTELSDDTIVKKQQRQLQELQERREQLEMMLEWQKSLIDLDQQIVDHVCDIWSELTGYGLSHSGTQKVKRWIRRFPLSDLIEALRISTEQYLRYDSDADDPSLPTSESVEKAFSYTPRICSNRQKDKDRPHMKNLYYIRGILRNRLSYINEHKALKLLEDAFSAGFEMNALSDLAKEVKNWTVFRETLEQFIAENGDDHNG